MLFVGEACFFLGAILSSEKVVTMNGRRYCKCAETASMFLSLNLYS